jgi:GNAT superfamily N-acetyltransferase
MPAWTVEPDVDHETAYAALATDRRWTAYAIADLEPPFDAFSRVAVARAPDGSPAAALLVLRHPDFTAIVPHGDPHALAAVLSSLDLPTSTFAFVRPEHAAPLGRHYALSTHPMVRMALDAATFRQPVASPPGIRRLTRADAPALHALYADYPGNAYVDDHLDGVFYGLYDGDSLIAAAGTQAVSSRRAIAAVGNIFTQPLTRGRGYGSALTAAVVADLLAGGCRDIVLNVAVANEPARRVYQRLGFAEHCRYEEGMATLP